MQTQSILCTENVSMIIFLNTFLPSFPKMLSIKKFNNLPSKIFLTNSVFFTLNFLLKKSEKTKGCLSSFNPVNRDFKTLPPRSNLKELSLVQVCIRLRIPLRDRCVIQYIFRGTDWKKKLLKGSMSMHLTWESKTTVG